METLLIFLDIMKQISMDSSKLLVNEMLKILYVIVKIILLIALP